MSIATKTAGVLLAATALCGIGSIASVAYADTPAGHAPTSTASAPAAAGVQGAQYSRGFHVTNLSGNAIRLVSVTGENSFDGRTPDGSILQQQYVDVVERRPRSRARIADTLTDKPHGSGLGLHISRQIIEHFGGRLWVDSELGRGACFSFTVPIGATPRALAA